MSTSKRIHVLTAVTRPENLPRLAGELHDAQPDGWELVWHWRTDPYFVHVGGQALKNAMLDEIEDGWVWILDDDTRVHPGLFRETVLGDPTPAAFIVAQEREDGSVLPADKPTLGRIDIGQAVISRSLIRDLRIPERYDGDGVFLEHVIGAANGSCVYVDKVLSYHNGGTR